MAQQAHVRQDCGACFRVCFWEKQTDNNEIAVRVWKHEKNYAITVCCYHGRVQKCWEVHLADVRSNSLTFPCIHCSWHVVCTSQMSSDHKACHTKESKYHYAQNDYRTELYYSRIILGNSCSVITEPNCFWNYMVSVGSVSRGPPNP